MSDETQRGPRVHSAHLEQYSHGYGAATEHIMQRPVSVNIAFFTPHLRPGMSLLDCGCGPGTNTAGLAEALAPGQVVGIDLEESQIELAKAYADEREVSNVRFEVGNVYDLPFPDASFDAAFAHTVLQHLKHPLKALEEISRVLRPGGLVGVREEDQGSRIIAPHDPIVEQSYQLYYRFWQHNGGDPFLARRHRQLLREAGFTHITVTASTECWGDAEATQHWGETWARAILEPTFAEWTIALGWADRQALERMAAASRAWGKHPDAFLAWVCCEAVAWKRRTMISIRQAEADRDRALIRELFWEYLEWANARCNEEYGFAFDIKSMLEQSLAKLEAFLPPYGRTLLAMEGARAAGIACMRRIRKDTGEIKRMYVRPEYRGRGIGRALLEALIAEAQGIGYPRVRLDSTRFMEPAHSLYRSVGFYEIEPYTESEIPSEFHQYWVFMEKQL